MPGLRQNLFSAARASKASGEPFIIFPETAQLRLGKNARCFFSLSRESWLYEVATTKASPGSGEIVYAARKSHARNDIETHRVPPTSVNTSTDELQELAGLC